MMYIMNHGISKIIFNLLLLIAYASNGQYSQRTETKSSTKLSLFTGVGLIWEVPIKSNKLTLRNSLSLQMSASTSEIEEIDFAFAITLYQKTSIRYYWSIERRNRKNRNNLGFANNYIGLFIFTNRSPVLFLTESVAAVGPLDVNGIELGIQRNLGKRFYYDISAVFTYNQIFDLQTFNGEFIYGGMIEFGMHIGKNR